MHKSNFIFGNEITVSEFSRYCTKVMRHCESTQEPIRIVRNNKVTLNLVPAKTTEESCNE